MDTELFGGYAHLVPHKNDTEEHKKKLTYLLNREVVGESLEKYKHALDRFRAVMSKLKWRADRGI